MSLSEDLMAVADMAAAIAAEGDHDRALAALLLVALAVPDLADRARALEGTNVPPHWRRQEWDGQPFANIRPLRRG
jgi:hypothetical protein